MRFAVSSLLLIAGVLLPACAERTLDAAAVDKRLARIATQDHVLDCASIFAEVAANNRTISSLAREQSVKLTQSKFAFGKDWRESFAHELQSLESRQEYLVTLARHKSCGAPAAPPPRKF
jgi:hypothetical protein